MNGLSAFHSNLAQTMGAGAWLGMVALAGAALLALSLGIGCVIATRFGTGQSWNLSALNEE